VSAFDVHNPDITDACIERFENISPEAFHKKTLETFKPAAIIFPDAGAQKRYEHEEALKGLPVIVFEKVREQRTGAITGHRIASGSGIYSDAHRALIVDDLCDGGATFVSIAKTLQGEQFRDASTYELGLVVSHGLFSKGKEVLTEAGIKSIFTTNSLPRNADGFAV
jgi:ribose-phosphate pyrophosphokinase